MGERDGYGPASFDETSSGRRQRAARRPPAERRDDVLDAALRLIVRDGTAAATMTSVARELDLTKPVVYAVFPNFQALADALIDREQRRCLEQIREALGQAVRPDSDAVDVLPTALGAFLRSVRDRPDPWRLVLTPVGALPDEIARRVREGRVTTVQTCVELLDELMGPDATDVDVEAMAEGMIAAAERFAGLLLADPEHWSPERLERFAAGNLAFRDRALELGRVERTTPDPG